MIPYEYLIQFSGPSHGAWFYFSVIFFVLTLVLSFNEKKGLLLIFPSIFFFIVSFLAFVEIIVLKHPDSSTGFSFDCIWFNASMGFLCVLFSYLIKFLFYFLQRKADERDETLVKLSCPPFRGKIGS